MAPPYSLGNTGTVLGVNAVASIIQASEKGPAPISLPSIQNARDTTVFVAQNSVLSNTLIAYNMKI